MELFNIEIEKNVLACLMSYDNIIAEKSIDLLETDFYAGRHQIIFTAIKALHDDKQSYDFIMVSDYIKNRQMLDNCDEILGELLGSTLVAKFNILAHVERLKDFSSRRKLQTTLKNAIAGVGNFDLSINELINTTLSELNNNQQVKSDFQFVGDLCLDFFNDFDKKRTGEIEPFIDTGFLELDNKLMLSKGDLCIITGRPGMGKSTLAQNIMTYITADTNKVGVFFSLEMSKIMVMQRLVSAFGGIGLTTLRSGKDVSEDDLGNMTTAIQRLKQLPLIIDDTAQISLAEIQAKLNKIRHQSGDIGVIVIDYIGLMAEANNSKDLVNSIGKITSSLKAMAKEFDCPVIALSQLNRGLESRPDKRPKTSDLRDSGKIEQDADQIIAVFREEYYDGEIKDGDDYKTVQRKQQIKGKAEVIILKNRNGPSGTVMLGFQGHYSRFVNLYPQHKDIPFEG